jgi:hypothetical protein
MALNISRLKNLLEWVLEKIMSNVTRQVKTVLKRNLM